MAADLVGELKSLRKGRGLCAGRLEERIGPGLRAAAAVGGADGSVVIRQKVTALLTELAGQLPADLLLAVLAAFAIAPEARLPLYQDRVRWAAVRLDRDPRTVRRRVDEAIGQLAELATAPREPAGAPVDGWHTTELSVAVALDRPRPESLEQWTIVAGADGLRELDLPVAFAELAAPAEVSVFYGGTLLEGTGRPGIGLSLPRPLAEGEAHDVAVRVRLPSVHTLPPYLVCVPRRPCAQFDLRVRFPRDRVPHRVWTLPGVGRREVADPRCRGHRQPVDQAGDVHLRFHGLTPGLAFGARWDFS